MRENDEVDTEICNPSKKHLVLDGPFVAKSVVRVDLASQSALRDGELAFFDYLSPDDLACFTIDDRNTVLSCLGRPQIESTCCEILKDSLEEDERDLETLRLHLQDIGKNYDLTPPTSDAIDCAIESLLKWRSTPRDAMWDTDYAFYLDSPLKHDACSDGIDLSDCFFCEYATGASAARVISKLFRGCLAFKGSRKTEHKPISRARTHGRPPDILLSNSHTSDQHDTSSIIFSCVFVFRIRKIECQLTERELHYNLSRLFMFFYITYLDFDFYNTIWKKKRRLCPTSHGMPESVLLSRLSGK